MKVFRNLKEVNTQCPTVLTVGTFDGIHLGHLQVIEKLKKELHPTDCQDMLITFDPHPKTVVGSENGKIKLLTPLHEKLNLLEKLNISAVLVIPFNREFSQMPYQQFVEKILVGKLKVTSMVVGYDHAFGKNREGHPEQLRKIAKKFNFSVHVVEPFILGTEIVSSTKIREFLSAGVIEKANLMLGRRYSIVGEVVTGNNRGKDLGFPTANLKPNEENKYLPKSGVYAVDVFVKGERFRGMMNIGHRPTFNFDPLTLETHIINFCGSIYGENIEVELIKFIREERKFANRNDLKNQLLKDKKECEVI